MLNPVVNSQPGPTMSITKGGNICYYTTPYNDFVYEIQMSFVKSGSQGDTCGGIVLP